MTKYPAVYIQWLDHSSLSGHWNSISDMVTETPLEIETLGYLIKETKEYVVVLPSIHDESRGFGDILILKSCIIKRKNVKI